VTLLERAADDFTGIPAGFFDVVVINSVVQYFPSAAYCLEVFGKAAGALSDDGALFVGDVRNLRLLECFHAGVAAARSTTVGRSLALERELLVDPGFFAAYVRSGAGFRSARITLKDGAAHNELTRYRYDVVLSKVPGPGRHAGIPVARWGTDFSDPASLVGWARSRATTRFRATGIPNARLARDLAARYPGRSEAAGLDPHEVVTAGAAAGYRVHPRWSRHAEQFDVYFEAGPATGLEGEPVAPRAVENTADLFGYFNDPTAGEHAGALSDELWRHLSVAGVGMPHIVTVGGPAGTPPVGARAFVDGVDGVDTTG